MNAEQILDTIEVLFPDAHCELNHDSPFQLLVAVVLSAQTTDAAVNKVTPSLFEKWPDAQSLQNAPLADVESVLRTIGLYRTKSRNIIALSQAIVERFDGQVPDTFAALQSLPGVGRKTANVVRSVAFDIPSLAVDTHVERVSKRLGLAKPDDDVLKVEQKLRRKIPRARWNRAHHDLIFFGRYFCTARKPECKECPLAEQCRKSKLDAVSASSREKKMTKKKIDAENILSQAEALVQAQNDLDQKTGIRDSAALDEARVLAEAAGAMEHGVLEAGNEKPLDAASDAQSLQQIIDSKIIDEQQHIEENKLKTALVDDLENE